MIYNDWRLPTRAELLTLVDDTKVGPASKLEDTVPSTYWSSTTVAGVTSYAWFVDFYGAYSDFNVKTFSYYVRCVRDSIYGLEWSASSDKEMTWKNAAEYAKKLKAPVYWREKESKCTNE